MVLGYFHYYCMAMQQCFRALFGSNIVLSIKFMIYNREAFGFSQLAEYETGGTVHIIVNNQIGFTTLPKEADSATYCRYGDFVNLIKWKC